MADKTLWIKDNKIIINNNKPVLCNNCPCVVPCDYIKHPYTANISFLGQLYYCNNTNTEYKNNFNNYSNQMTDQIIKPPQSAVSCISQYFPFENAGSAGEIKYGDGGEFQIKNVTIKNIYGVQFTDDSSIQYYKQGKLIKSWSSVQEITNDFSQLINYYRFSKHLYLVW